MPTATRPSNAVEEMVARVQAGGHTTLAQLRDTFEQAGIGPAQARTVLSRLTELGVVIGADDKKPTSRRTASTTRPAATSKTTRSKATTRPAGRACGRTLRP